MPSPQAPEAPLAQTSLSVLSLSIPVAMGYVPLGMVYGFLAVQAGLSIWITVAASVLVFAGAAQFMMVSMLAAGLPIAAIAAATLVLNLRHMFYGLSLLKRLPSRLSARWYMVFGLTDETYSVLTTMAPNTSSRHVVLLTLLNQCWWVLGSALGALMGARSPIELLGLDFALAALFTVLAVEQWRTAHNSAPLWVALISYAVSQWLAPTQALALAIGLSVLVGLLWPANQTLLGPAPHD
jgi:4-azaleucine resistance transporter AzlC